jgi:hypothetical protein
VAILPEPTVTREVAAGTLVAIPITGEELVRPIGMLYRRGKELGVTVRRFMELLRAGEGSRGGEVPLTPEPLAKTEPLAKQEAFAKSKPETNGKPEKSKSAPLAAVGG